MRSARVPLSAFLLYSGVTAALAHSLLPRLGTAVPNDLGDPLLNTWILWWNSRKVPLTTEWWNAPAFFPIGDVLAFSEHLVGLTPLTSPLIWVSHNPLLAHNVAFLLSFALSATAAYALGVTVTGRHDAALVAGLAYGFAPYRMAQLAHLQVLASFWMPLALAALHLYLGDHRRRWLVVFGVATAFQGLTNGYYLLFFPVLVALWVFWFAPPGRRRAVVGAVGVSLAAVGLLLLPFLLRYRAVDERFRLERQLDEVIQFSARIDDLLRTDATLTLWGRWLATSGPEAQLFPGLTCVILVAVAVASSRRNARSGEEVSGVLPRRVRLALGVVASVLSLVTLARLAFGPWRLDLLGLPVSTGKLSKPLTLALYAWLIVAFTGPFARRLVRSRSPLAFYSLGTCAMWTFAFGPAARIGGVEVLYWAPYRWLSMLPGFSGLRVPARFGMLAVLCLSTAAAIAWARLRERVSRRAGVLLVVVASAGIVAEGWRSVPVLDPPPPSVLEATDGAGAAIELPFGVPLRDGQAMYRGMRHRHPVVNGYSGREPPHWIVLGLTLPSRDPRLLRELATRGVRYVMVLHEADQARRWQGYVRSYPGAERVRSAFGQTLFSLPPPEAPAEPGCEGEPLTVRRLVANDSPEEAAKALDGDPETRWRSEGAQRGGEELDVDLGETHVVCGVELALGPHYGDFPRELAVEGSLEANEWSSLFRGTTGVQAFRASLDSPRRMPVRVSFPPARARHLRLRQLGRDPEFPWTVGELVVLGSR